MSIRLRKDSSFITTQALPAAAANANCTAFNLSKGDVSLEQVEVQLVVPALPSLVDAKTVTFTFQDSADGTTFAAIPELSTLVMTGAGGVGAATATRTVRLPSSVRQYINVNAAVLTAGGDNTAVSYTFQVLF